MRWFEKRWDYKVRVIQKGPLKVWGQICRREDAERGNGGGEPEILGCGNRGSSMSSAVVSSVAPRMSLIQEIGCRYTGRNKVQRSHTSVVGTFGDVNAVAVSELGADVAGVRPPSAFRGWTRPNGPRLGVFPRERTPILPDPTFSVSILYRRLVGSAFSFDEHGEGFHAGLPIRWQDPAASRL
ncbi:hypothetical protein VUR80DRAFT_7894 [Thermomyces stellatus]